MHLLLSQDRHPGLHIIDQESCGRGRRRGAATSSPAKAAAAPAPPVKATGAHPAKVDAEAAAAAPSKAAPAPPVKAAQAGTAPPALAAVAPPDKAAAASPPKAAAAAPPAEAAAAPPTDLSALGRGNIPGVGMLNVLSLSVKAAARAPGEATGPPTPSAATRAKRERAAQVSQRSPVTQLLSSLERVRLVNFLPRLFATREFLLKMLRDTPDEDSLKAKILGWLVKVCSHPADRAHKQPRMSPLRGAAHAGGAGLVSTAEDNIDRRLHERGRCLEVPRCTPARVHHLSARSPIHPRTPPHPFPVRVECRCGVKQTQPNSTTYGR